MDVAPELRARECPMGAADWATIGRRIARAAAMATAVRVIEVGGLSGRQAARVDIAGAAEGGREQ